jgi:ribosomal protein L37AE/L43A
MASPPVEGEPPVISVGGGLRDGRDEPYRLSVDADDNISVPGPSVMFCPECSEGVIRTPVGATCGRCNVDFALVSVGGVRGEPPPNARVHDLKVWPDFYARLATGEKTFELRKDDRGYRAGDWLRLREWSSHGGYSGREMTREVTYLARGSWLAPDHVAMALGPVCGVGREQDRQKRCPMCNWEVGRRLTNDWWCYSCKTLWETAAVTSQGVDWKAHSEVLQAQVKSLQQSAKDALGEEAAMLIIDPWRDIAEERRNQDVQWGGPGHDDEQSYLDWTGYIYRQLCMARDIMTSRGGDVVGYRSRLVKMGALAIAAIESIDRQREGMDSGV